MINFHKNANVNSLALHHHHFGVISLWDLNSFIPFLYFFFFFSHPLPLFYIIYKTQFRSKPFFPSFAQKLLVILKSLKSAFDVICALIFLFDCFSNFLFFFLFFFALAPYFFLQHQGFPFDSRDVLKEEEEKKQNKITSVISFTCLQYVCVYLCFFPASWFSHSTLEIIVEKNLFLLSLSHISSIGKPYIYDSNENNEKHARFL